MGRHLGIDFKSILVDFGKQVGRQNRAKIDAKRHRKNDVKKKGTMIAKNLEKVPAEPSDRGGPGSRGGSLLTRGVTSPRVCVFHAFDFFWIPRGLGCWIVFKMDFSSF